MPAKLNIPRIAISWCAVFVVVFSAVAYQHDGWRLIQLYRQHRSCPGTVVGALPHSNNTAMVNYTVDGVQYTVQLGPYSGETNAQVVVYFFPPNPEIADLSNPANYPREKIPYLLSWSILITTMLSSVFWVEYRNQPPAPLPVWLNSPKGLALLTASGAVVVTLVRALTAGLKPRDILPTLLIFAACALFLFLAWKHHLTWRELFRTPQFWMAVVLAIFACLIQNV